MGLAARIVNAKAPALITETELYRNAPADLKQRLMGYSGGRTLAQGADTAIWLASALELAGMTSKFFQDCEELKCEFRNEQKEEKLWKICEELVKENHL